MSAAPSSDEDSPGPGQEGRLGFGFFGLTRSKDVSALGHCLTSFLLNFRDDKIISISSPERVEALGAVVEQVLDVIQVKWRRGIALTFQHRRHFLPERFLKLVPEVQYL